MAEPWEDVVARRIRHVAQTIVCLVAVVMAVASNGPIGLLMVLATPIIWLLSWPTIMLVIQVPAAVLLSPIGERKRGDQRRREYEANRSDAAEAAVPRRPEQVGRLTSADDRYGLAHQNLRAAWKDIIRAHGAECMERECLMPSRRIEAGASWDSWDLAHDHDKGGRHDYLGPAHKICNQAEALRRGVTWDGAPSLPELLDRARSSTPERVPRIRDDWDEDDWPPDGEDLERPNEGGEWPTAWSGNDDERY